MGDIEDKINGNDASEDDYIEEDDYLEDAVAESLDGRETLDKARKLLVYSNCQYLHYEYMARAAELALHSQPDDGGPYVGAVLVKNCNKIAEACKVREPLIRAAKIIGRGGLHLYHAEEKAIQMAELAKQDTHGAVLYVTLEPCTCRNVKNRHRKINTPCVELIAKAGIKSVVIGLLDSGNPYISGRGVLALADSGIEVVLYNAGLSEKLLHLIELGQMRRESKRKEYFREKIEGLSSRGAYIHLDKINDEGNTKSGKKRESNRLKKIIDDGLKEYHDEKEQN